jgi:hypothetical protein
MRANPKVSNLLTPTVFVSSCLRFSLFHQLLWYWNIFLFEQIIKICQFLFFVQLDYFETVLNAYFSQEAHQALKSLQGNLLDKACESASDETPGHHRRPTRGSDDPMADDRSNPSVSADDLLVRSLSAIFFLCLFGTSIKWPC